ncbi:putative membrane protein [Oceaniovalibus guishaninsula JLT2003]|uniref:Putative membrane protein n=1 Tax=Oceaniovalibus guishaninsula JLT2003 TaxID=1231392 RepID=K2HFG0_9RHOB|nr:hypothetical protein [Oceaniovalibus guishaninsula]EKE45212.1 putative membrane protein [Oceaniovalibus guishaninsula JLT2003]
MRQPPWHFWPVVFLGGLWHLFGCFDYLVTQYGAGFWTGPLDAGERMFVETLPAWVEGAWGIAVWGGLLGIVLMAARAAFAPLLLAVSAIATVVLTVWMIAFSIPSLGAVAGQGGIAVMLGACVAAILLWLYARRMRRTGVID